MQHEQCWSYNLQYYCLHPSSSPFSSPSYYLRIREPHLSACLPALAYTSWQGSSNSWISSQSSTDASVSWYSVLSRSTQTTSCRWKSPWTVFLSSSLTRYFMWNSSSYVHIFNCFNCIISPDHFGNFSNSILQISCALITIRLRSFWHFTVVA